MQEWLRVCLLLCVFGYFIEFRPSEPFIVDYLTGPCLNLTAEEVYQTLFPVSTYSYLSIIVLTFLITDFFRYKPIIILCGLSGVTSWSILAWSSKWTGIALSMGFHGTYMATEVAYYTYIYAKVEKQHYQKVTSYTRAATLAGSFSGSVLGQILMFTKMMNSKQLNFLTLGALIIASIWAFFLPSVKKSLYFHQATRYSTVPTTITSKTSTTTETSSLQKVDFTEAIVDVTFKQKISDGVKLLWDHFISAYTQTEVVLWSLWFSLAMAGFLQVVYYSQVLWQEIEPNLEQTAIWNGAIEAALTILGAAAAILAGYLKIRALHFGLLLLAVCSLLGGGTVILSAQATTLWVSYVCYVSFGVLYNFMITYSSYEIAKRLTDDSFGLVFGINTMMALAFQSILTVVVISEGGFNLAPRSQFRVYGGYFVVLGTMYLIASLVCYFKRQ